MMKFVAILTFAILSQSASAATFAQWLEDTSPWCFEDTSGMWDHGRIVFKHDPWKTDYADYNVTDAPGDPIVLKWSGTRGLITGRTIKLWRNTDTVFRAYVDVLNDRMIWYWNSPSSGKSYLRQCK